MRLIESRHAPLSPATSDRQIHHFISKASTGLPLAATTVCSPMSPVVPVHQESSKNDISLRQSSSQVIKILKVLKYGVLTSLRRGVQHTC